MICWFINNTLIYLSFKNPFQRFCIFSKLYVNDSRFFYFSLTLIGISVTIQKSKKKSETV